MSIQLTRHEEFAVITLDRPQALNALNYDTLRAIGGALDELERSDARALFFTGTGPKAFCAGADIKELTGRSIPEEYEGTRLGQALWNRVQEFRLPTIAVVNGYALGGGCELALACTFRLGTANAKFGLPEIKLGLVPGYGGTQRLPRLVGAGRALELVMTGRTVAAEEALKIGLLDRIVEGDPLAAAAEFARAFSAHSLLTLRLVRDAVLRGSEVPLAEGLRIEADLSAVSFRSEDGREGTQAFVEKRPAKFRDK